MQETSSQSTWQGSGIPNLRQRKRPDGRFDFMATYGQRRKMLVAKERTEAKRELPGVLAELNGSSGVPVGDRSVTLQALYEAWVEREEGPNGRLAENTLTRHKGVLVKHVIPILKPNTKAADLTVGHVRRMIDKLVGKGLSGATVHSCVSALSCVLGYGVRNESLPRNVVRDLERGDRPSAKRTSDPRYLSITQVELLFSALSIEFRPIAETLFYAGLRISEALSLRWRDVRFEEGLLDVPGTKTEASAATIPLHPILASVLKAHRVDQGKLGVQRIGQDALVFSTATGRPQSRRNALRAIANAGCRIGLSESAKASECPPDAQPIGCHDLRHSLAANAFEVGLNDVEVCETLRHANPNVTRTIYAGITDKGREQLATKLAAIGGGA